MTPDPQVQSCRRADWNYSGYQATVTRWKRCRATNLLDLLPPDRIAVESNTKAPTAQANGPYTGVEGIVGHLEREWISTDSDNDPHLRMGLRDGRPAPDSRRSTPYARYGDFTARVTATDSAGC